MFKELELFHLGTDHLILWGVLRGRGGGDVFRPYFFFFFFFLPRSESFYLRFYKRFNSLYPAPGYFFGQKLVLDFFSPSGFTVFKNKPSL